jgi:hypothetical protein
VSPVTAPTDGETVTLLRSIRRWLLVLVALFGALIVTLGTVGYEVSGATDGALYAAIGVIGALVALAADFRALLTLSNSVRTSVRSV